MKKIKFPQLAAKNLYGFNSNDAGLFTIESSLTGDYTTSCTSSVTTSHMVMR